MSWGQWTAVPRSRVCHPPTKDLQNSGKFKRGRRVLIYLWANQQLPWWSFPWGAGEFLKLPSTLSRKQMFLQCNTAEINIKIQGLISHIPHPHQSPQKTQTGWKLPRLYLLSYIAVFSKHLQTPTTFQELLHMLNTVFYHSISIPRILDAYANMLLGIFILCFLYSRISQLNNSCL